MDWKEDETSNSFSLSKLKNPSFLSQQEFVDKYDYNPPVKLSIDKFYFLKTFGSSFLYFLIFFFYYLLLVKNVFYFYYIIVNFITFPFARSEEHTSELQSRGHLVCRLLLENKNNNTF